MYRSSVIQPLVCKNVKEGQVGFTGMGINSEGLLGAGGANLNLTAPLCKQTFKCMPLVSKA